MAVKRDIETELIEDIGLTIAPGIKVEPELPGPYMNNDDGPVGPTVGVNMPDPLESRFAVHDPIFRKVHRTTKNISGNSIIHRAGNYKTSTSNGTPLEPTINYDIVYGTWSPSDLPVSMTKQVRSTLIEDQYYGAWDYRYKQNEGTDESHYGNLEYYREGSRVYFQGECSALKSYNSLSETYNEYPIVLSYPLGEPLESTGIIFKLAEDYRPKRAQKFMCPVMVAQVGISGIYTLATISINTDGVVELLNIIADATEPTSSVNTLSGSCRITWLNMDNVNFSLYSGPNVHNATGGASLLPY